MELHKPNSKFLRADHAIVKKKKSFLIQIQMFVVEHVSLQNISLLLKIKLFPIIPLNEHMYLAFSFFFFLRQEAQLKERC